MSQRNLKLSDFPKLFISLLSLIGIGIMSYLTYLKLTSSKSFCDFSESVSCDYVTTSIYSEIFGMPISLAGLGYFLLVLLMVWFIKSKKVFEYIFMITILMLIPSLYFTIIEVFVIKSICILCETSKVIMIIILITSYLATRKISQITPRLLAPLVITGVVLSGVLFFLQAGNPVKADYSKLVACLNQNNVMYYKSVKCNNCRRQERLLGQAYKDINAVECHPEGKNPQPELCLAKKITKTPTFIIEKDGVELSRATGLQPIDKLAEFGGCSASLEKR